MNTQTILFASIVAVATFGVISLGTAGISTIDTVDNILPEAFADDCNPGEVHDPVTGVCGPPKGSGEGKSGASPNGVYFADMTTQQDG